MCRRIPRLARGDEPGDDEEIRAAPDAFLDQGERAGGLPIAVPDLQEKGGLLHVPQLLHALQEALQERPGACLVSGADEHNSRNGCRSRLRARAHCECCAKRQQAENHTVSRHGDTSLPY